MKKIILKIFVLALLASIFTACSSNGTQEEKKNNLDVIKVGMDLKFPPFMYLDSNNKPAGFEVDIANAFGEFLGRKVEIKNIDFSLLIPAVDTGEVDILIADVTKTQERMQKVDFSDFYRYSYTLALVNKDFALKNNITDSMSGEDFFAIKDAKFVGLSGTLGVTVPQEFGVNVSEVTEIGTGLIEVSKGIADVLVASNEVHNFHAADKNNTIVYSGLNRTPGSSFVVKKGNTELLAKANEFIKTMYEKDGLYSKLDAKYDPIIAEFLLNDKLGLEYIIFPNK